MIGKSLKYLLLLALLGVVFFIGIIALSFNNLKAAGQKAFSAKNNLETAAALAQARNWELTTSHIQIAVNDIESALDYLALVKEQKTFKYFKPLRNQISDLEYLLQTAEIIARSFDRILPITSQLDDLYSGNSNQKFADLPTAQKNKFFQLIYESEPELNGLKANLDLAQLNLAKIHRVGILWPVYKQITDFQAELSQAAYLLGKMTPMTRLLPVLAGHPSQSDFLIIMHNNDELRPSGGFIGVFGLLTSSQGEIVSLQTYDSYHLDMPAVGKWEMEPPMPIKKYMKVENWYLRDANWSPDWPTSARQIQEIFYGESAAIEQVAPDFTGVIGITPDFVSDLLQLVGPIEIRGEIYTPENLQPLLQYTVEVAYLDQGISQWDRKDVVNELLAELKNRLYALETSSLPALFKIFNDRLETKDIQMYFNNSNWQALAQEMGIDGGVYSSQSDYLLVVDANLAAFKTDAVVRKSINYDLNNKLAKLTLAYQHEGGFDWRTTRYRSYTRVYVPLGSELISLKALEKANLEAESISSYDDLHLNKTVFAFFFSVEPGTTGALELSYNLPATVIEQSQNNEYYLLVQHQAGRRTEEFKAMINGQIYNRFLDRDLIISPYAN